MAEYWENEIDLEKNPIRRPDTLLCMAYITTYRGTQQVSFNQVEHADAYEVQPNDVYINADGSNVTVIGVGMPVGREVLYVVYESHDEQNSNQGLPYNGFLKQYHAVD